ncbi:TNR6 factor, partial [Anseranas semipalmata]|nr:TNR6 factor [Anseranas semipalmata]
GYVKNVDCPTNIGEHCVPCKSGEEFIDHSNDLDKCRRCRSCDSGFGLEVAKQCTATQNTECTCAKNHFCSSVPCTYCEPCTTEYKLQGYITTKDLSCSRMFPNTILSKTVRYQCQEHSFPFMFLDVDLSSHIPGIVEEMTLQQVKTFVRHHKVPEPVIDQIVLDNCNDTSEQKIKLFQDWYQRQGIKGACRTLISSLRELKMCAAADKIEEKLKTAVYSNQEGGESYNDNIEQSKTCSQEGGKSYHSNAELSKTYSDSLEET